MADQTPSRLASIELTDLEEHIADPEPMCLVMIAVEPDAPDGGKWTPTPALLDEVSRRLRTNLRRYDELTALVDGRFVMLMRTLADATTLDNRMHRLFDALDAPYELGGVELQVRALLGAAVRRPGEEPTSLLGRVVDAVDEARRAGARGPILR